MQYSLRPRRRLVRRVAGCVFLAVVVTTVALVAQRIRTYRDGVLAYQESHGPAAIVGKTADEILSAYGVPFGLTRDDNGRPQMIMYKDVPHGQYCTIELRDGVAVRMIFSFQ